MRFRFDRDRDRFIAARAMLRRVLAGLVGADPAELRFLYGRAGKPALSTGPQFSLSHSDDLGALAVAYDLEIGIDVERLRPIEPELADRFFAEDESAALRALAEPARTRAFFACWTRKEAYVKSLGDGLLAPLDRFSVSLDEPARLLWVEGDPGAPARWRLAHLEPARGFVGAIAAPSPAWRLVRRLT
jgi:4'-phosphopantetheinyl transferase